MNLWHLRIGFGFALEALGREVDSALFQLNAETVLAGLKIKGDPFGGVKDRFARFTQDCRLTPTEVDTFRDEVFEHWQAAKGKL